MPVPPPLLADLEGLAWLTAPLWPWPSFAYFAICFAMVPSYRLPMVPPVALLSSFLIS